MNFGYLGNLLKEAGKAKRYLKETQERLKEIIVETSASGGMIQISSNANGDFLSLKIHPDLLESHDIEFLEKVVLAAFNQSTAEVRHAAEKEMSKLTNRLNISELLGF